MRLCIVRREFLCHILPGLVNDVALANLAGYYKIGDSDLQAVGASLRYFSLGDVPYNPITGESTGGYSVSPY